VKENGKPIETNLTSRYPSHRGYHSYRSQPPRSSNYFHTPIQLTHQPRPLQQGITDNIGCKTADSGKDIHRLSSLDFIKHVSFEHIAFALNHIFHFRNIPPRKQVRKRRFVMVMLISILLRKQISDALDAVELIVIGSLDQGGDLSVDCSVCGGRSIIHFIWPYSDNVAYTRRISGDFDKRRALELLPYLSDSLRRTRPVSLRRSLPSAHVMNGSLLISQPKI